MHALAELHERGGVEADEGDVARRRLLEDGGRRRPEGHALGLAQEGVELRLEVEAVVGLHEMVEQPDGQLAGRDADGLVGVAVDDVVAAAHALDRARLAAPRLVARQRLQLEGDVLSDVAEPGALVEALDEAAAAAAGAGVVVEPGHGLEQLLGEARQRDGGVVLEGAEVDDEVDGLLVGPDVGAPVDPRLEDREVRAGRTGGVGTSTAMELLLRVV